MNFPWSPELELTARLSRVAPTSADDSRVREILATPLRWDRVFQLAGHHGVIALVERSLTRLQPPQLPAAFLDRLRRERISATSQDLLRYGCWLEVSRAFAADGVPVLTLKGFHAVFAFYGELGLRAVGDLDLLVHPGHVERAIALLQRLGYELTDEWRAAWRNVGVAHVLENTAELSMRSAEGVVVDLHWGVGRRGTLPTADQFFARAEWLRVADHDVRVPSRVMFMGMLLVHGQLSQWARLRWVIDIAEGLATLSTDELGDLIALLDAHGQSAALPSALQLMDSLWGRTPAMPTGARGRADDVLHRHHCRVLERERDSTRLEHHLGPLKALRDLAYRSPALRDAVWAAVRPTYRDWAVAPLPPALHWGYFFVRPYRVLRALVVRRPVVTNRQATGARAPAREGRPPSPALTFVTAIFRDGPDSVVGGRGRGIDEYLPSLINIGRIGAPLVVYCPPDDAERVRTALAPYFVALDVRAASLRDFPLFDAMMASKREYVATLNVNDRNEALCMMKSYWLDDAQQRDPFGDEHYYWIDAGLTHHGIFPERVGGVELAMRHDDQRYFPRNSDNIFQPKLGRALLDATPAGAVFFCALPSEGRQNALWRRYGELAAEVRGDAARPVDVVDHLVGGIFGGHRHDVHAVHQLYASLLGAFLASRTYTLEEQVFSAVYAQYPEKFALQRFGTWWFYSPGEVTSYLDAEGDSFYKVFSRMLASGASS